MQGLLFYTSLVYYMCYTILLSFSIFRTFHNANEPIWNFKPKHFHFLILFFTIFIDVTVIITSSLDGIWPMGVCLPSGDKTALLWYITLPMCTTSVLSAIFLIAGICVVKRNMLNASVNNSSKGSNSSKLRNYAHNNQSKSNRNSSNKHGIQISRSNTPVMGTIGTTSDAGSPSLEMTDSQYEMQMRKQEQREKEKREQESFQQAQFRDLLKRMTLYACGVVGTFALLGMFALFLFCFVCL